MSLHAPFLDSRVLSSCSLDLVSGHWSASSELEKLSGIPPHYPRTVESWFDLAQPEDASRMAEPAKSALEGRHPFSAVYRIRRVLDGQEQWVHGTGVVTLKWGLPTQFYGTILDITSTN